MLASKIANRSPAVNPTRRVAPLRVAADVSNKGINITQDGQEAFHAAGVLPGVMAKQTGCVIDQCGSTHEQMQYT